MKESPEESAFKRDSMNQVLTDLLGELFCTFLTLHGCSCALLYVYNAPLRGVKRRGRFHSPPLIKHLISCPLDLQRKFCCVPPFCTVN